METIVVGLHTFSIDSKAAAALLQYHCKHKCHILFAQHGMPLPKNIPSKEYANVIIVSLGVNILDYEGYEHVTIENDGKTSVAEEIMIMSLKENKFLDPVDVDVVRPWVERIKRFQVRVSSYVDDEALAFNLITSIHDTYVRDNSSNYFWTRLIEDPDYQTYIFNEANLILKFKKQNYNQYIRHMYPSIVNGHKCLMFNKRESDSSAFLSYPDRDSFDFFIAYQDNYKVKDMYSNELSSKRFDDCLLEILLKAEAKTQFTVYRNNNPELSSVEFTKQWGGLGHAGVSTFTLSHLTPSTNCSVLKYQSTPFIGVDEELNFTTSDDIVPSVKKYKNNEIKYGKKLAIKIHDRSIISYVTNNGLFPYNLGSVDYINYTYEIDYIEKLLRRYKCHSEELK